MTADHDDDDLFHPRWRRNAIGVTSKAAAPYMKPKAPPPWDRVLSVLEASASTPEEVQVKLQAEGIFHPVSVIRLRITEPKAMGMVCDSGALRIGESLRCKSVVWLATTEDERQQVADSQGEKGGAKAE